MAHTKTAARKLATQSELSLLDASFPPALKELTPSRLKQKITRARKLQDKYRDLAQQQRGEARGKRSAKSTRPAKGNDNTVAKQEMFAEARARLEGQMEKLEAKVAKELARKEKAAAAAAAKAEKAAAKMAKAAAKSAQSATKKATKTVKAAKKTATKTVKAAKKTVKKTARKTGTAAKRAASKATTTARKAASGATRGVRKAAKVARSGNTKHQGHVSSRGRRRQAKRDSR